MSFIAITLATPAAPEWMLAKLERFSDRRWALPPNRYLVDAAGMEGVLGPPPAIARAIAAHLRHAGIAAALGLAATRTAALLRSHAANATKLADLPLSALAALDGCGDAAGAVDVASGIAVLTRWGLRTLGELAALPPAAVAERLGRAGVLLQRWARGDDAGLRLPGAEPDAPEPEITRIQAFEPALETTAALLAWLERELAAIGTELERTDGVIAAIALELEFEDGGGPGQVWRWQQRLIAPHRETRRLLRQIETALNSEHTKGGPIRLARLRIETGRPRRLQAGLFGDADAERERDERLVARLRAILGDVAGTRVGSAQLLDLHRPGAFRMTSFETAPPPPTQAKPPLTPALCLRALRPPLPVTLALPPLPTVPGGWITPIGARWRPPPGGHRVEITRAAGPWRTSGCWWSDTPDQLWSRDEWDVETTGGALYRLAHDRRRRIWLLLGTYD